MTDRWERFNRRFEEEFLPLKKRINITIYGSYSPESEMYFLTKQKEFMINNGYALTKLVIDYDDGTLSPLEISKRCLMFSDVNYLIFTRNGKKYGVIRELAFVSDAPEMIDKTQYCVVFDEIHDSRGSVPPLSLDDIKNSDIIRHEFSSEKDLQEALLSKSLWYGRKLKRMLLSRADI